MELAEERGVEDGWSVEEARWRGRLSRWEREKGGGRGQRVEGKGRWFGGYKYGPKEEKV